MNEGWATFWHKRILEALELPQELHLEFLVRHDQVLRPIAGQPESLPSRHESLGGHRAALDANRTRRKDGSQPDSKKRGTAKLFEAREVERDAPFSGAT